MKKAYQTLQRKEPLFKKVTALYGLPPQWQRPQTFASLLRIILEQQVSLESAAAAFNKLTATIGDITPEKLLQLSNEQLRACYFSRQKTLYAQELATALVEKKLNLSALGKLDETDIRSNLTRIKGIGDWTTDIYLIFCIQHPDIFPPGDIAAIQAAKDLFGLPDKAAVVAHSANWQPYRSYATRLLWLFYLKERGRRTAY